MYIDKTKYIRLKRIIIRYKILNDLIIHCIKINKRIIN